ncbi:MAG: FtsB family cell division protein [Thermoleophilaceae bacterium]
MGRLALLGVLGVIVLLYVAPISHYITQSRTAGEHRAELRRTEGEHARLKARVAHLSRADAVEREARRFGMVRRGERAFVIEAPTR